MYRILALALALAWPGPGPGPPEAGGRLIGGAGAVAPAQGGRRPTYGLGPSGVVGSHAGDLVISTPVSISLYFPTGVPIMKN